MVDSDLTAPCVGCQCVSQHPLGAVLSWLSVAVLSGHCWELGTAECPQTFLSWQVLSAGLGCEQRADGGRGQSLRAAQSLTHGCWAGSTQTCHPWVLGGRWELCLGLEGAAVSGFPPVLSQCRWVL